MYIPARTVAYILLSLALSANLGEAKYKPPQTISPDYKKCRHETDDPSCLPSTSDTEVNAIRDSHGRFGLLNQKHRPSPSADSAADANAATSLTSTIDAPAPTPSAPSLVYGSGPSTGSPSSSAVGLGGSDPIDTSSATIVSPKADANADAGAEQSSYTLASRSNTAADSDNVGSEKWGSATYGRPFARDGDADSSHNADDPHSHSPHAGPVEAQNIGTGAPPFKRSSSSPPSVAAPYSSYSYTYSYSPYSFLSGLFSTASPPAPALTPKQPINPNPATTSLITQASNTKLAAQGSINAILQSQSASPSSSESGGETGNAKWGFGSGGWGRPFIKRDTRDFAFPSSTTSSPPITTPHPAPSQSKSGGSDGTGNAKWGFGSGGWGRPFARDEQVRQDQEKQKETGDAAGRSGGDGSGSDGQVMEQASPGGAPPFKRQFFSLFNSNNDNNNYHNDNYESAPPAPATPPAPAPAAGSDGAGAGASNSDSQGNAKWGFGSGGWGRPFVRTIRSEDEERESTGDEKFQGGARPF